jgi:hypothetical protein
LALSGLAGCAQVPPVVVECQAATGAGRPGPALVGQAYGTQHSPLPLNSVQFDAQATASRLAVQDIFADRTGTDTVEVTARFVSCADAPSSVRVRTSFMRVNHAPAEPTSAWKVVHLAPRAISHYTELSTSRDVASYLIEIARE